MARKFFVPTWRKSRNGLRKSHAKNFWFVCREYAGIAEAGGVKNIVCSLCEELAAQGNKVTVFIPLYPFTNLSEIKKFSKTDLRTTIQIRGTVFPVSFSLGRIKNVSFVFVESVIFENRRAVYTYTTEDEKENIAHKRGSGFADAQYLTVLFQKAVVYYGEAQKNERAAPPDLVHCHDATTALVPVFAHETESAKEFFLRTAFAVSIHNAGPSYRHEFYSLDDARAMTGLSDEILLTGCNGNRIEPYLLAAKYSQLLTVSPWYARELTTIQQEDNSDGLSVQFFERKIPITGITNGIDAERYNPKFRSISQLPFAFDPAVNSFKGKQKCKHLLFEQFAKDLKTAKHPPFHLFSRTPKQINLAGIDVFGSLSPEHEAKSVLFAYHGRVVRQKGIGVFTDAMQSLLSQDVPIIFAICGQGEWTLEDRLIAISEQFPGKMIFFRGYSREVSRFITAAADFFVLPSNFEPCGLEDFIALLFGTIPVAHSTGGLQKIIHAQTGFLYQPNDMRTLTQTILFLAYDFKLNPKKYLEIASYGARYTKSYYSWKYIVRDLYIPLYENLMRNAKNNSAPA
jgi:starch synthase